MSCFDSAMKNVRNDLGITHVEAALACGVTASRYLEVERDRESPKAARFIAVIVAAYGIECTYCEKRAARFVQEPAKGKRPAFLHCGCIKC